MADNASGAGGCARPAAAVPAVRLRGDLRGDGRAAGDDPAARPAAARVPAAARARRRTTRCAAASARCTRRTRCSARAGCRLGLMFPEIYEMQVRAIVRAAIAVRERTGEAPLVEIMHPLVGFAEELRRLRELTDRDGRRGRRARVPVRDDDRAAARVHARRRDRRARGLLLLRDERPHADRRSASHATTPRASSSRSTSRTASSSRTRSRRSTRAGSGT